MSKSVENSSHNDVVRADAKRTDGFDNVVDRYDGSIPPDAASIPSTLYHYTNAGGLHGMLSGNSIWLTHSRYLNDSSEIEHTASITREVISDVLKEKSGNISSKILGLLIEKGSFSPDFDIYIFSLSAHRDSLSQWRGYTAEGRGFTMGLETKELLKYRDKKAIDGGFDILRVEYDRSNQVKVLKNALVDIIERAEELIDSGGEEQSIVDNAVWSFRFISFTRSVSNKHSSFADEKEWRITLFLKRQKDDDFSKNDDVFVRVRGDELIPYMVAKPGKGGKLPLSSVGIGPGFSRDNQRNAACFVCRCTGYAPEIYNADSPYTRD